jgi:hypothetical protein
MWQTKINFADRGEQVNKTIEDLEEDTAYQLKVVVHEQKAMTYFEETKVVDFKTCKRSSENIKPTNICRY